MRRIQGQIKECQQKAYHRISVKVITHLRVLIEKLASIHLMKRTKKCLTTNFQDYHYLSIKADNLSL